MFWFLVISRTIKKEVKEEKTEVTNKKKGLYYIQCITSFLYKENGKKRQDNNG